MTSEPRKAVSSQGAKGEQTCRSVDETGDEHGVPLFQVQLARFMVTDILFFEGSIVSWGHTA